MIFYDLCQTNMNFPFKNAREVPVIGVVVQAAAHVAMAMVTVTTTMNARVTWCVAWTTAETSMLMACHQLTAV